MSPWKSSWVDRLTAEQVEEVERVVSRATAAMPELLRDLVDGELDRAYGRLRDYQVRNGLERGFAGVALLQLRRANPDGQVCLSNGHGDPIAPADLKPLTDREVESLQDAALGFNAGESAARTHRSRHTVIAHRRTVLRKLGAKNMSHAVYLATSRGVIPPADA